ncbi:6-phosphogluconolactonase-like [Tubulanus polymorphus]|uniref:6-phosphogluconolactonase-like n=1 Tax=Tubulanus polymorphus TaxID=672921 RepID=UPI003DA4BFE2
MAAPILHIIDDESKLIKSLTELILSKQNDAVSEKRKFSIGVSGGSVAKYLSQGLPELGTQLNYDEWRVYFCDERHVPFTDSECTYKYYKENLMSKAPLSDEHVFKIDPSVSVEEAAVDYEKKLRQTFPGEGLPQFDVLVLGMGPDGHTCSLFPGHPLLEEKTKPIAAISDSPKPPPGRVTMTYPLLNNARCVIFVACGESKAQNLKRVLEGNDLFPLPAGRVRPTDGDVHWFLDSGAAKLLDRRE